MIWTQSHSLRNQMKLNKATAAWLHTFHRFHLCLSDVNVRKEKKRAKEMNEKRGKHGDQ